MNSDLPILPPPHTRLLENVGSPRVLLRRLDGSRLRGKLQRLDLSEHKAEILLEDQAEPLIIPFAEIKAIYLEEHFAWHRPGEASESELPIDLEPRFTGFVVKFVDGDVIKGKTLGFRADRSGLCLYPERPGQRVGQCYIPATSIKSYQMGQMIGKALVESGFTSQHSVEEALGVQRLDREEKLGEILGKQAIVTATELESALTHQASAPNVQLGKILLDEGLVTQSQLDESLTLQHQGRRRPLGEVLVDMGALSEQELHIALARKFGIPRVELARFVVDKKVFASVPQVLMERYRVVPLYQFDGRLAVAMVDPLDVEVISDLRFAANCHIDPVLAESADIERLISVMRSTGDPDVEALVSEFDEELAEAANSSEIMTHSTHIVVRLVNKILSSATHSGSTDIHLEPRGRVGQSRVRERIDGRLRDTFSFPSRLHRAVVSRIKIMANMDVTEVRRPQDGQIDLKRFGISNNAVRVATIPSRDGGEDVVLRMIGGAISLHINSLGLSRDNERRLLHSLQSPSGLLLATGPTGSGKSTTLHAILEHLNKPEKKIWTIEDPIEIVQPGLRQVQASSEVGLTFDSALRAFMRLDPDIIMVGEIRDPDTAGISVSAALTGHLVLSTLHTNGASEAITRLLDMDVDSFDFADSLKAVISQRLTRRLCSACLESRSPRDEDLDELAEEFAHDVKSPQRKAEFLALLKEAKPGGGDNILASPRGCSRCNETGYKGQLAVHELLTSSAAVKTLIHANAGSEEVRRIAINGGMRTLRQDGIIKVLSGRTSLRELHGSLGPITPS